MASFIVAFLVVSVFLLIAVISSSSVDNDVFDCDAFLTAELKKEIGGYRETVDRIVRATVAGEFAGSTFDELAFFVDKFGNRIAGSKNLENAIDYMIDLSKKRNLENVHGENVDVQQWIRGEESATMLQPRMQKLPMLGLGSSVGTPPEGITAEVLTVTSFDELERRSAEASGKIVLFVPEYVTYGKTVTYRSNAASRAARHGAVASLIRSIAPFSISSPHTGMQTYQPNVTKIPTAAISVEDAHLIKRITDRGQKVVVNLKMEAHLGDIVTSRNTIAEIRGSQDPDEVVIISGHIDSWDVGQGAMDDGGGAFISWNGLAILKSLGLRARRTIRTILWTAEEFGYVGAKQYFQDHRNETDKINFIMESDEGTFNPYGINYVSGSKGTCVIQELVKMFASLNATTILKSDSVGSDIGLWLDIGVPGAALLQQDDTYFWFHHSNGDTMDVEDSKSLDKNTALWAATAYVLADLSIDFPRD